MAGQIPAGTTELLVSHFGPRGVEAKYCLFFVMRASSFRPRAVLYYYVYSYIAA